jgi:DNA ligase-4
MVLAFGDVCTLLEGAEKLSTRRPRYAPDEEGQRTRQHVTKWFEDHRTDLGMCRVAVKRDDLGFSDPFRSF